MSIKTPNAKIAQLSQRNKVLLEKNKSSNAESRVLRARIVELKASRHLWKNKYKLLKQLQEGTPSANNVCQEEDKVARHHYGSLIISLCISIYLSGNCGLRSVVKIVKCICLVTGIELGRIPSKSSLENWIKKLGFSIYEQTECRYESVPYALLVDESMVIGQEKLLVILGVPAIKTTNHALAHTDLELLYMGVEGSWTGAKVAESLQKVMEKEGKKASYVISDKASILCKGIRAAGLIRVADVGHEIARITEIHYKKGALESFTVAASLCKTKCVMTDMAYLVCPKQRKMARFMNLAVVFEWGQHILSSFSYLNAKEKEHFAWVKEHQDIIYELSDVFGTTKKMLEIIKNEGLSHATIHRSIAICSQTTSNRTKTSDLWRADICCYLQEQQMLLPDEKTTWHASTDVLESMFGTLKARQATNPLHGVTSFVLFLPLMTKIDPDDSILNINIKKAMENVYMSDLEQWNKEQLIENQVVKRNKLFKK